LIAQNTAMPVWIYCRRENKTLRQAILDAGFQLRHRVVSRVFLHSLRRTQVLAPAEIKASQQEQLLSPSA